MTAPQEPQQYEPGLYQDANNRPAVVLFGNTAPLSMGVLDDPKLPRLEGPFRRLVPEPTREALAQRIRDRSWARNSKQPPATWDELNDEQRLPWYRDADEFLALLRPPS